MYGVVLWSDPDVRKAVIWCEDCGQLEYYDASGDPCDGRHDFFETGDYVEYEMSDDAGPRRVVNAQTLRSARCPRVERALRANGNVPLRGDGIAGRVINLSDHQTAISITGSLADISRRG